MCPELMLTLHLKQKRERYSLASYQSVALLNSLPFYLKTTGFFLIK